MTQASLLPTSVQSAHLPHISIIDGQPVTTSLNIAEVFGKRHDHVLRSIEKIIAETPQDFTAPNFGASTYFDSTGRELPMYRLTFDAFVLLAMGYTGKKAMQFKLAYIAKFNRMRNELANTTPTAPTALTPSTTLSRKPLTTIIKVWAKQTGQKFSHCYSQVNAYFNLEGVAELPVEWLPDAIAFVQKKLDAHTLSLEASKPKNETSELFLINYEKKVTANYQKKALASHKDADLLQENYHLWRRANLLEKLLALYEREQPEKPWGLSR